MHFGVQLLSTSTEVTRAQKAGFYILGLYKSKKENITTAAVSYLSLTKVRRSVTSVSGTLLLIAITQCSEKKEV